MNLRNIARAWLGISDPPPPPPQNESLVAAASRSALAAERSATDAENALSHVIELQLKFDALAEMLGVVVVCNFTCKEPNAEVRSTRRGSLLDDAERYLFAATATTEIRILMEQQRDMTKTLLTEFLAARDKKK